MHLNFLGVYIAETVHPSIRNNLTIIPSIFMSAGFLFTWVIGYFETWRNTAYILTIPSIMVSLCLIALPESPYWLVEAQKIDLAKYVITTKHLPVIIWKKLINYVLFFFHFSENHSNSFEEVVMILQRKSMKWKKNMNTTRKHLKEQERHQYSNQYYHCLS